LNSSLENNEIRIHGRAVSRGVAVGRVVCLHGRKQQFLRLKLDDENVSKELKRFTNAVRNAKNQLKKITEVESIIQSNIFETHLLTLEDYSLLEQIKAVIKEKKVNAEWAIDQVRESYLLIYRNFSDEHFRDRQNDFEDVMERLLVIISGDKTQISLESDSIIVAKDVKPSTFVELSKFNLKGIITEEGGWTSHTFILAREQNLPSVTIGKAVQRNLNTGDFVIVDGFNGTVILNPTESTVNHFLLEQNRKEPENLEIQVPKGKLKTLDGREISILANHDVATGFGEAKSLGAEGIGLFRSEYLFNENNSFPVEEVQYEAYLAIGKAVGKKSVKIRTFDLSVESVSGESEKNPALGLRAIRLGISNIEVFKVQIRALLRASKSCNIEIVLPMISDISEILTVKELIESERNKLEESGTIVAFPKLGVMIEVPSAVLMAKEIAEEVDFLCLGTNDLVQYLLAVDRDNETVENWFRTLHPAVIRSIKMVLDASEKAGISTIVCGEMAGSPVYATILVGLGITNLSMNPKSIPRIRKVLSQIAFDEASFIVKKLADCRTSSEIESMVSGLFLANWSHLFSKEQLPQYQV
jgi:phosphoenolpyruvate-protein phosphotransferase (PTS system enzyme I)